MSAQRPFGYGQKLRIDPPLPGERIEWPGKGQLGEVPIVKVVCDDGTKIIVKSATKGFVLKRVTCLTPGADQVTFTPIEEGESHV